MLRDVGNTTSKRKRERKEEGESSPSMFNACSFTYVYTYSYVYTCSCGFKLLFFRPHSVLSNDPSTGANIDAPIENDVSAIKSYRRGSNDGD